MQSQSPRDDPGRAAESAQRPAGEPAELPDGQTAGEVALPKIIPFQSLARCGEEIWIENEGQVYRLRRTRQGKLILTK